jgi:transcriptional regulator with XRE-family HTH domain
MVVASRVGRRTTRAIELAVLADGVVQRLGEAIRSARRRRRLTQAQLGERVGVSRGTVARIEQGRGQGVPITTWLALAAALHLTPRFELQRDWREEPVDAGHLAIQDLALRLGRMSGYDRTFELRTRASDPSRSVDVALRSDRHRRLVVVECWNTIGDVGAGARTFGRKLAEAGDLAVAIGGDRPYAVHGVWIVRASRRNRDLVARYPEVFRAAFPGSSTGWVAALTRGDPPPRDAGLVWCDVGASRVHAWRAGRR